MKRRVPKIYYRVSEIITGDTAEILNIYVLGRFMIQYEKPKENTFIDINTSRIESMFYELVRRKEQFNRLMISEEEYRGSDLEESIEFLSKRVTIQDKRAIDKHLSVILESIGMLEE